MPRPSSPNWPDNQRSSCLLLAPPLLGALFRPWLHARPVFCFSRKFVRVLVHTGLASLCAYRPKAWHGPLTRVLNVWVAPLTGATPFLLAQERCAKEGHPDIRVSLRETSLTPVLLRGPAYMGHPWPITPLAASMRLVPLRNTCARPPDGTGARACKIFTGPRTAASGFLLLPLNRDHAGDAQSPLQEAEWNRRVRG